jgi:hypothetical protein
MTTDNEPNDRGTCKVQAIVNELADAGITTSLCFGQCGKLGKLWSVDVLRGVCQTFPKPFGADSLLQAVEIAKKECQDRGWV